MAIVINPDGTSKAFSWGSWRDAQHQLGGYFDSVPGQIDAGFLVLVNDMGRLTRMPRNTMAEILTGYPEIYGPAVVASFKEAGEDELLHRVVPDEQAAFQRRLTTLTTAKREG